MPGIEGGPDADQGVSPLTEVPIMRSVPRGDVIYDLCCTPQWSEIRDGARHLDGSKIGAQHCFGPSVACPGPSVACPSPATLIEIAYSACPAPAPVNCIAGHVGVTHLS